FQHRCLRRIKQMQEAGKTILFVSHDTFALKALCSRLILLNNGRVEIDGRPSDVLNRYQRLIMEREEAFDARQASDNDQETVETGGAAPDGTKARPPENTVLRYSYRHGDKSAEVLSAEMLDNSRRSIDLIETGDQLLARMRVRFHRDVDEPVFGFLIRNRHGIHAYGANTEQRGLAIGRVLAGEVIEVSFAFDCWLGTDLYNVSFAVHSADGISYDWLDGVLFFRVVAATQIEGLANLNASAVLRRVGRAPERQDNSDEELSLRSG
ncbi:MAG TPA: Wzt carbohydrate-binding domain-containing protein, partial [Pyrinomonadaceae bacterium]